MGTPVMVLGNSGTGKSTSLRNLNPDETFLVQPIQKRLPFRNSWQPWDNKEGKGQIVLTDNSATIEKVIHSAIQYGKNKVVIDDFQYIMANEFMRRSGEVGFTKFTEIAKHAWELIMAATNADPDLCIYFLSHTETNDSGQIKAKTIGKLLDEKITLEGMFTIVLRTHVENGQYQFLTQNNGLDTVKSPKDMFSEHAIDNDLNAVDQTIREYFKV